MMKVAIVLACFSALVSVVDAGACAKSDGQTANAEDAECDCGSDAVKVAKDKFCVILSDGKGKLSDAKVDAACTQDAACTEALSTCKKGDEAAVVSVCQKDEICLKADGKCNAACAKTDGSAANAADAACMCGSDNVAIAKDKFCVVLSDGKGKLSDAKVEAKCTQDAKCTEALSTCNKGDVADVVSVCQKDETCQKADGKCKAAEAVAEACAKTDGQTAHDKDTACECGSDKVAVAKDKFCVVLSDGKGKLSDAKVEKKCTQDAKCTEALSTCNKGDVADVVSVCQKDETCQKADGKCKAAAAAATTTTTAKATTKAAAATTAAASATTAKPLSAADAAKVAEASKAAGVAYDAVVEAMKTFDTAAAAKAIAADAAVTALKGADMSKAAVTNTATEIKVAKATLDDSLVKDAASMQSTGEILLKAAGVKSPSAFTCTFIAARRLEARSLAAKEYTMTATLKAKAAFQAQEAAKKTAELQAAAAASGSSGASHMAGVAAVAALFFF